MKQVLIVMCVLCLASAGMAQVDEKAIMGDSEPGIRSPAVDSYSGLLWESSPVWNRIFGNAVDTACNASMSDSGADGQYYEVIPIQVTAAENLECEIMLFTGADTVMALYCDPFDPANPQTNVVAYDDDDGWTPLSAFLASDNILLSPGNTYYLVVSTFNPGDWGTFTVDFTSATVVVVPVELQSFSVE